MKTLAGTVLSIDIFRQHNGKRERKDLWHSQWFCLRNCLRAAISSYLYVLHLHLFILAGTFIQTDVQLRQNAIQAYNLKEKKKKRFSKGSSKILCIGKNLFGDCL